MGRTRKMSLKLLIVVLLVAGNIEGRAQTSSDFISVVRQSLNIVNSQYAGTRIQNMEMKSAKLVDNHIIQYEYVSYGDGALMFTDAYKKGLSKYEVANTFLNTFISSQKDLDVFSRYNICYRLRYYDSRGRVLFEKLVTPKEYKSLYYLRQKEPSNFAGSLSYYFYKTFFNSQFQDLPRIETNFTIFEATFVGKEFTVSYVNF